MRTSTKAIDFLIREYGATAADNGTLSAKMSQTPIHPEFSVRGLSRLYPCRLRFPSLCCLDTIPGCYRPGPVANSAPPTSGRSSPPRRPASSRGSSARCCVGKACTRRIAPCGAPPRVAANCVARRNAVARCRRRPSRTLRASPTDSSRTTHRGVDQSSLTTRRRSVHCIRPVSQSR